MADSNDKHPLNVPGRFYNDLSCIDCGMCPDLAPNLFRRDDEGGYSYMYQQPRTIEEVGQALEAMEACPTESIGEEITTKKTSHPSPEGSLEIEG